MEALGQTFFALATTLALVLGLACAIHALLNKREPNSAIIWVFLCLAIPLLGAMLYLVLGVNRIHRQAEKLMLRSRHMSRPGTLSAPTGAGGVEEVLPPAAGTEPPADPGKRFHQPGYVDKILYPTDHVPIPIQEAESGSQATSFPMEVPSALLPARIRTMARIGYATMGMPLLAGNKVKVLYNGDEAYPAMVEAIQNARKCVYLDTYIFDNDRIGKFFVAALADARARGVEVKVQVDGLGTLLTSPRIDKVMRRHGIDVARFIPPRLFPPQLSINLRNHRKLLLIDGKVGFTGGMNISSTHVLAEPLDKDLRAKLGFSKSDPMQDIHFKVEGPILEDLQLIFAREWQFTSGEILKLPPVDPSPRGYSMCRTILDGPDDYLERFHTTLLGAISAAKRSVHIMTPYFLPPRPLITALQSAAMRGVDVAVILPEVVDHRVVKWATANTLWEFIGRGVHIYYQPGPFNHSKLLLIDGYYSHVGSANLDPRSLRLNFELTMEIFDLRVAGELERHFEGIRIKSREYTLEDLQARTTAERLRDAAFWLFSPYM